MTDFTISFYLVGLLVEFFRKLNSSLTPKYIGDHGEELNTEELIDIWYRWIG